MRHSNLKIVWLVLSFCEFGCPLLRSISGIGVVTYLVLRSVSSIGVLSPT